MESGNSQDMSEQQQAVRHRLIMAGLGGIAGLALWALGER